MSFSQNTELRACQNAGWVLLTVSELVAVLHVFGCLLYFVVVVFKIHSSSNSVRDTVCIYRV